MSGTGIEVTGALPTHRVDVAELRFGFPAHTPGCVYWRTIVVAASQDHTFFPACTRNFVANRDILNFCFGGGLIKGKRNIVARAALVVLVFRQQGAKQ